jgi:hypothetical protein
MAVKCASGNAYRLRPGKVIDVAIADIGMLLLAGCQQGTATSEVDE